MRRKYVVRDGRMVEARKAKRAPSGPFILGDIKPYWCPVTNQQVTSRAQRQQIIREHKLIEIGNEAEAFHQIGDYSFEPPPEVTPELAETVLEGTDITP